MSSQYPSFLYFADDVGYMSEVINGYRTAANATRAQLAQFSSFDLNGGCVALRYAPSTVTATPPTTISCQQWDPVDTTVAAAPWYVDRGIVPPGTAYGFYITDITGLDDAHLSRPSTPYGSGRGGGWYGRQGAGARVCKLNIQLLGASEIDLEHLFRWLSMQLVSCCDGCSDGGNVIFRRYCPSLTGYDSGALANEANTGILTSGLTMAKGAVLLEGLTWEAPPVDTGQCFLRAASFTFGFSDPCLYVVDETLGTTTYTDLTAGAFQSLLTTNSLLDAGSEAAPGAWSSLAAMPPYSMPATRTRSDYIGTAGAVVTIYSDAQVFGGALRYLPDLRIVTYLPVSSPASTDPNLAHRISEVVLTGIPSGQIVEVNMHTKRVRTAGSFNTGQWSDGSSYLAYVAGQRRWAGTNCDGGFLRVEPFQAASTKALQTASMMASSYTVNVLTGTRFSCPC